MSIIFCFLYTEDDEGEGFLCYCGDKTHQPLLVNTRLLLSFCHFFGVIPFCMLGLLEMYSGISKGHQGICLAPVMGLKDS